MSYKGFLAILLLAVWVWAAINPVFRQDWLLRNYLVFLFFPLIMLLGQYFELSKDLIHANHDVWNSSCNRFSLHLLSGSVSATHCSVARWWTETCTTDWRISRSDCCWPCLLYTSPSPRDS